MPQFFTDRRSFVWVEDGQVVLRKKGQGKSLMVSDFLCECHGALYNPLRNNEKVRTIMAPGSGVSDDGWWTNENLCYRMRNRGAAR
jgi:hypothetical protein